MRPAVKTRVPPAEDIGGNGAAAAGSLVPQKGMEFLVHRLLDPGQPIAERFRALFALRNHRGEPARSALIAAMRDPSNLLAHEAAFALGQMQDAQAVPALREILCDVQGSHPIVHHEATEVLGAIGNAASLGLLREALESDPTREVRETCELALHRIEKQQQRSRNQDSVSPFFSVDPAEPAPTNASTASLREILLDDGSPMHERYAGLFALRNRGGREAIDAIVAALGSSKSALLKHEVAYVLGQLQDKGTMDVLVRTLEDVGEHPMVRHEAAEALGSIADSRCVELLKKYLDDQVALSMLEFEQQGRPFEYLFQEIQR